VRTLSSVLCIGLLLSAQARAQQCEYPIADLTKCKARTARAGHTATVSNPPCGPEGSPVMGVLAPQGYAGASFKPACSDHDICYETCNAVKASCDAAFNKKMKASCLSSFPVPASGEDEEWGRRGSCSSLANLYTRLVSGSTTGQNAYDAAQKKACECCECGTLGFLLVNEPSATVKLMGCFGDAQGKVSIGGTELAVQSWASDTIVCNLPSTGPGSNGDVIVEIPSTTGAPKKTNVRQLTEWKIPLHYQLANAYAHTSWTFEGTGSLRFRADVAPTVPMDGGVPVFPIRGLSPTTESALPVAASGSFPVGATCTQVLTGSGTFPTTPPMPATLVLGSMMKIDTSAHTGSLGLAFGATAAAFPFKANYVGTNCPPSGEQTIACAFGLLEGPGNFPSPLGDGMSIGPIPAFAIAFDPQFKLLKKMHTDATTGGTLTVEWTADVVPISPPK